MRRFVPHRFLDGQWTCLTCGETHPDPCNCPCCNSGAKLIPADEEDEYDLNSKKWELYLKSAALRERIRSLKERLGQ